MPRSSKTDKIEHPQSHYATPDELIEDRQRRRGPQPARFTGHRDIDLGPKPHHGPFLSQRRLLELLVAVALRNGAAVQ